MTAMNATLFSVVIPTRDRPHYLAEAVASVLTQTVDDLEVIVVDDGSTMSLSMPADRRVRLIVHPENRGISAARNSGIRASRGQYVTFLDDDDIWLPHRLELALTGHRRAPIALCWATFMDLPVAAGRRLDGRVPGALHASTTPPLDVTSVERSVLAGFDESYRGCEDVEWWVRMCDNPVATVPEVGCLVRRHHDPRPNHGVVARMEGGQRLLREHAEFFRQHRKARAFRLLRVGLLARRAGRPDVARRALWRSFTAHPTVRAAWSLAGACRPTTRPRKKS